MGRQPSKLPVNTNRLTVTGGRQNIRNGSDRTSVGRRDPGQTGCSRQRLHYQTIRQGVGKDHNNDKQLAQQALSRVVC